MKIKVFTIKVPANLYEGEEKKKRKKKSSRILIETKLGQKNKSVLKIQLQNYKQSEGFEKEFAKFKENRRSQGRQSQQEVIIQNLINIKTIIQKKGTKEALEARSK